MSKGKMFRDLMKRGMVTAPGCFECIGARAIERAGFEAAYMTGAGTAALPSPMTATAQPELSGGMSGALNAPARS